MELGDWSLGDASELSSAPVCVALLSSRSSGEGCLQSQLVQTRGVFVCIPRLLDLRGSSKLFNPPEARLPFIAPLHWTLLSSALKDSALPLISSLENSSLSESVEPGGTPPVAGLSFSCLDPLGFALNKEDLSDVWTLTSLVPLAVNPASVCNLLKEVFILVT